MRVLAGLETPAEQVTRLSVRAPDSVDPEGADAKRLYKRRHRALAELRETLADRFDGGRP